MTKTELGIKYSLVISAGVVDLPCFPAFFYAWSQIKQLLIFHVNLFVYFFVTLLWLVNSRIPHQKKGWHQLCPAHYTVLQMKNSRRSAFATIQSPQKYNDSCAPNYQLLPRKCSGHYASLLACYTKKNIRIASAINPVTTENMDDCLQMNCRITMHRATVNRHLGLSGKRNGTQRRTKVSPWCVYCTYYGMPKGTSRDEATSNSEKIKSIALVSHYRVTLAWRHQAGS